MRIKTVMQDLGDCLGVKVHACVVPVFSNHIGNELVVSRSETLSFELASNMHIQDLDFLYVALKVAS
ncbi:hypothetical protein VNO77_20454 [Canavalia gladiata]|uniref:Uncharacterized protein n=1 Tax=Canavalia gladiata TaxID=3824 RepID=A0AAN9LTK4_CANGL